MVVLPILLQDAVKRSDCPQQICYETPIIFFFIWKNEQFSHFSKSCEMPARLKYFCTLASYCSMQDKIENIERRNKFFERVEKFRYLENNLTEQNSILEEIKRRLKPGNVCRYSVQNILSSSLLTINIDVNITEL
jgi:hypothetical protein